VKIRARLPWLLLTLFLSLVSFGQVQNTPNIGLQLPPFGSNNWNVPLNYNFTQLDLFLSGNLTLPGISISGYANLPGLTTWVKTATYPQNAVVAYQGVFYVSLVSGNINNIPMNGSFWSNSISGGGGLPVGSGIVKVTSGIGGIAVAGTDFMGAVTAPGYGYVPVSNGAGGIYSAQQAALFFGSSYDQFAQQETNNANYTTFRVNNENNVFFADGFTAAGQYTGIGVAQATYGTMTEYPLCQAVSYAGLNYVALSHPNIGITPGTNLAIWSVAVPNSGPTTAWDCGAYTAALYAYTHSVQAAYVSGGQFYTTQGFVEPNGLYSVNLFGRGIFGSFLTYTGAISTPVIYRPDGGNNYTYLQIKDFIIDGGGVASSIMDLGQLNQSYIDSIQGQNIAPGASGSGNHYFELGLSPGDAFQMHASNITWTGGTASTVAATVTANLSGGGVGSFTVNNGGSLYLPASATNVYHVKLLGNRSGTANTPCAVMPSGGMAVTVISGAVTAVAPPSSGGSGCSGTISVQVYASFPVDWGMIFNGSDGDAHEITGYAGDMGILEINAGNDTFYHIHPSVVPNGITTNVSASFFGTELDDVYQCGITFNQPFSTTAASVVGTQGYLGGSPRRAPGSATYCINSTTANINFGTSSSLLDDSSGSGQATDWHEFLTTTGPIVNPADYLTKAPAGMTVYGNDTTVGQVMGDYASILTTANLLATSGTITNLTVTSCTGCSGAPSVLLNPGAAQTVLQTFAQPLTISTPTAAILGTNQNSPFIYAGANYYTGSVSAADTCGFADQANGGSNPLMSMVFHCTGSPGGHQLDFDTSFTSVLFNAPATMSNGAALLGNNSFFGTEGLSLGTAIAAAATIAPLQLVTHITGTAATVETITPPTSCAPSASYVCEIRLISDAGFLMGLTGNIAVAKTTVTGQLYILDYDANTSKWYPTN
jgi:hypothetical protein